jgi:DNA-binding NarL/FixJ family response regulator
MSEPRPRVVLADDFDGIRAALTRLLAPSCDVVGSFADAPSLLDAAVELRPDVILLDLHMPKMDGLEACRRARELVPTAGVIILTADDDVALKEASLKAGASAFLPKRGAIDFLLPAVLAVQAADAIAVHCQARMLTAAHPSTQRARLDLGHHETGSLSPKSISLRRTAWGESQWRR